MVRSFDVRQARSSSHLACEFGLTEIQPGERHESEAGCKPVLSPVREPERKNDGVPLIEGRL
jgi:hypothetical protein